MMGDVERALGIARHWADVDGAHHKAWVIDQMVRALTGDDYETWVKDACNGDEGPNTYEWDVGIAP